MVKISFLEKLQQRDLNKGLRKICFTLANLWKNVWLDKVKSSEENAKREKINIKNVEKERAQFQKAQKNWLSNRDLLCSLPVDKYKDPQHRSKKIRCLELSYNTQIYLLEQDLLIENEYSKTLASDNCSFCTNNSIAATFYYTKYQIHKIEVFNIIADWAKRYEELHGKHSASDSVDLLITEWSFLQLLKL